MSQSLSKPDTSMANGQGCLILCRAAFGCPALAHPSYYAYSYRLKNAGDFAVNGAFSVPKSIRWANLSEAWETGAKNYFWNSVIVTGSKVPIGILLESMAAFAFDAHAVQVGRPGFCLHPHRIDRADTDDTCAVDAADECPKSH